MFSLAILTKKCKENRIFSKSVDHKKAKQIENKKIHTQVFTQGYIQRINKTLGENSKPYFS